MDIPLIEQIKIQAQALLPLIKALQAELGTERANSIVRNALGAQYRAYGEKWSRSQGARSMDEKIAAAFHVFAAAGALDYEVVKQAPDAFDINITGCRYAEFFKKLGVPELGFLLVCGADFPMAEGFGSNVRLTRTQTIMQGSSHCDFRYALNKVEEEGGSPGVV